MAIRIRPAHANDFTAIELIENEADRLLIELLHRKKWSPAPTGATRAAEEGFILIAENEQSVTVGFVHVIEVDDTAHLEQLSVLPEHGRRGYGRMLVNAARQEAAGSRQHKVDLAHVCGRPLECAVLLGGRLRGGARGDAFSSGPSRDGEKDWAGRSRATRADVSPNRVKRAGRRFDCPR